MTRSQKHLLYMLANLDQILAAIENALVDPLSEDIRPEVEEMRAMGQIMLAQTNDAIQAVSENYS